MSSSANDHFTEVLFWIICVVCGVVAAGFLIYWIFWGIAFGVCWIVPYLLFCVLPFGALTAAYGFGLAGLGTLEIEVSEDNKPNDHRPKFRFHKRTHYRRLAFLFPVFVAVTYGIFDIPQDHRIVTEKVVVTAGRTERVNSEDEVDYYGNSVRPKYRKIPAVTRDEERIFYQWPELVNTFNQVNSAWQDVVPFLKQGRPYQVVVFDRNVWSVIAWVCLLLSGPLLFWVLSDQALDNEDRDMSMWCESSVSAESRIWESRQEAWKTQEAKLDQYYEKQSEVIEAQKKEIAVLTAKLNFTPEGQQAKLDAKLEEEKQKPGVLDSDLL